jgi:hypothetical protein
VRGHRAKRKEIGGKKMGKMGSEKPQYKHREAKK